MVVFVLTTDMVEFLHALFCKATFTIQDEEEEEAEPLVEQLFGVPVFKLHGNMAQRERTDTFIKFRSRSNGILICTDVGSYLPFFLSFFICILHWKLTKLE